MNPDNQGLVAGLAGMVKIELQCARSRMGISDVFFDFHGGGLGEGGRLNHDGQEDGDQPRQPGRSIPVLMKLEMHPAIETSSLIGIKEFIRPGVTAWFGDDAWGGEPDGDQFGDTFRRTVDDRELVMAQ